MFLIPCFYEFVTNNEANVTAICAKAKAPNRKKSDR